MSVHSTPHTPHFPALTPEIQSVHGTPASRPVSMYSSVNALGANDVASQDWWLRDQAQIAIAFDGWSGGMTSNGGGLGNIPGPVLGTPELDASGQLSDGRGEQEWPGGRSQGMGNAYMNTNRNGPQLGDLYGGNGQGGQQEGQGRHGSGGPKDNGSGDPSPVMGGWYGL